MTHIEFEKAIAINKTRLELYRLNIKKCAKALEKYEKLKQVYTHSRKVLRDIDRIACFLYTPVLITIVELHEVLTRIFEKYDALNEALNMFRLANDDDDDEDEAKTHEECLKAIRLLRVLKDDNDKHYHIVYDESEENQHEIYRKYKDEKLKVCLETLMNGAYAMKQITMTISPGQRKFNTAVPDAIKQLQKVLKRYTHIEPGLDTWYNHLLSQMEEKVNAIHNEEKELTKWVDELKKKNQYNQ